MGTTCPDRFQTDPVGDDGSVEALLVARRRAPDAFRWVGPGAVVHFLR